MLTESPGVLGRRYSLTNGWFSIYGAMAGVASFPRLCACFIFQIHPCTHRAKYFILALPDLWLLQEIFCPAPELPARQPSGHEAPPNAELTQPFHSLFGSYHTYLLSLFYQFKPPCPQTWDPL